MPKSTLESLPNEILIEIIEKYINGIDVVLAFNHQLNSRFDGLIARCQRLRFNFVQCRKDDFRVCVGLLPAYLNAIGHLALSDYRTPGEIYAFLSFHPEFTVFKQLRSLSIRFNAAVTDSRLVESALRSLTMTNIQNLSIEGTNTSSMGSLNETIGEIFHITTLKRLYLSLDLTEFSWSFLVDASLNIEHLTLHGMNCQLEDMAFICRTARRLMYLNVSLLEIYRWRSHSRRKLNEPSVPLSKVQTLILTFERNYSIELANLADCIRSMPSLKHLEVRGAENLVDSISWQALIETSLPLLTHFTLWILSSPEVIAKLPETLESFQSPFWVAKHNFNFIITEHVVLDSGDLSDRIYRDRIVNYVQPVAQMWIAPNRQPKNGVTVIKMISKLLLTSVSNYEIHHRYYPCVNSLELLSLDSALLTCVKQCVSPSQIKEVTLSNSITDTQNVSALLAHLSGIHSLTMSFNLLELVGENSLAKPMASVKSLDISIVEHEFNESAMRLIADRFPCLEHLKMNTRTVSYVPRLRAFLLHLFSLTLKFEYDGSATDTYLSIQSHASIRNNADFFFQRETDFLIIWVDLAALEDRFWGKVVLNSLSSINRPQDETRPRRRRTASELMRILKN